MGKMDVVKCTQISIDCVKNDAEDIRCGGPEYEGFDFWVDESKVNETKKFILSKMKEFKIPLISIKNHDSRLLEPVDVWDDKKIEKCLKDHASYYAPYYKESKSNDFYQ